MMRRLVWERFVFRSLVPGVFGLAVVGLALSIAGCGSVKDSLGLAKRQPDEFAVVKRQPLIIPPNYDLRPPRPGAPSTAVASSEERARAAMTGAAPGGSEVAPAATGVASAGILTSNAPAGSASGQPATTASAAASPGQAALMTEAGASAARGSGIRGQLASETEGRSEVAPATFEQIMAEPAVSGPEAPEVVRREQTPIELAE